jgi:hypothetical protein
MVVKKKKTDPINVKKKGKMKKTRPSPLTKLPSTFDGSTTGSK